jgi:hypothetical protein
MESGSEILLILPNSVSKYLTFAKSELLSRFSIDELFKMLKTFCPLLSSPAWRSYYLLPILTLTLEGS